MLEQLSLNTIGKKVLIDREGKIYGHIKDAYFEKSTLKLKYLIIHGGKVEELLEKFKVKEDTDPIIRMEDIEKSSREAIFLRVEFGSLKTSLDLSPQEKAELVKFSELKDYKIYDENLNPVGKINDVLFGKGSTYEFELGGKRFYKLVEKNNCTELLTYSIKLDDLAISSDKIILKHSLRNLEDRIKTYLKNIERDLYLVANEDDKITDDELQLIEEVNKGMTDYAPLLVGLSDQNTDQIKSLEKTKDDIIVKMIGRAKIDNVISQDERKLIQKFAGHFKDNQKIIQYTKY